MKTILVASSKGGAGKTTLATNLAAYFALDGKRTVLEMTGLKTCHKDGYKNAIWILLDYGEVMVHVFREDARNFYNLEGLWADAAVEFLLDEN